MQDPKRTPDLPETDPIATENAITAASADAAASEADVAYSETAILLGEEGFLYSLNNLCPDDIPEALAPPLPERHIDPFSIIRIVALIICLAVLLYSGKLLIDQTVEYLDADSTYSDLSNQFWGSTISAVAPSRSDLTLVASPGYQASQTITDFSDYISQPTYNERLEQMKARLSALQKVNKEIYGYVYIENTQVDYPLVQHSDNNYYLTHDFNGKRNKAGSIFVDYRNTSPMEANRNLILYGHHMRSGSTMFHTLDNYFDETFFQNNPDIYIYTFDGIYRFEVFSVYITKQDYHYIRTDFETDEQFLAFCEEMRSNSLFIREGVTFNKDSHLLTLSTCTNIIQTDRICIQAVLVEVET